MEVLTVVLNLLLDDYWSCDFQIPEKWYPQWVIALIQLPEISAAQGKLHFAIKNDHQTEQKILIGCSSNIIVGDFADKFVITLNSSKETLIDGIYLHMQHEDEIISDCMLVPLDISTTKIIHHPEQDVIIAFDFRDIFDHC